MDARSHGPSARRTEHNDNFQARYSRVFGFLHVYARYSKDNVLLMHRLLQKFYEGYNLTHLFIIIGKFYFCLLHGKITGYKFSCTLTKKIKIKIKIKKRKI